MSCVILSFFASWSFAAFQSCTSSRTECSACSSSYHRFASDVRSEHCPQCFYVCRELNSSDVLARFVVSLRHRETAPETTVPSLSSNNTPRRECQGHSALVGLVKRYAPEITTH